MGTTQKATLNTTVGVKTVRELNNTMGSTSKSAVLGTTVKTQGLKTTRDIDTHSTTGSASKASPTKTLREGQMASTTKSPQSSGKSLGAGGTLRPDLSGTGRDMTQTRQEKRMADTARGEDDRPKLKIIKVSKKQSD